MKSALWMSLLIVAVFLVTSNLIGIQSSYAVEEHHEPGAKPAASTESESMDTGMMKGGASGSGPRMKEMMRGPDDESAPELTDIMGTMDEGMMSMMMSHMMGGPGGMGKMMGKMGRQGKGRGRGMAHMGRVLDDLDLTPEQWDQVRALARERMTKMVDLWARRMKLQIELSGLRWDKEIDAQKVKDLFAKKAEVKAEMFLAGVDYLNGLKKILTQEQLKKLEDLGY